MLFRVLFRLIETKNYFHHYFFLLSAKISPFEDDYSRFLECIFNLLIFKPLIEIIKFISFCLNTIFLIFFIFIKANNIVLSFVFIELTTNLIFFVVLFDYKLTYLFIEFVFIKIEKMKKIVFKQNEINFIISIKGLNIKRLKMHSKNLL